jgi:exodeoxyribonuclease VII small subunit
MAKEQPMTDELTGAPGEQRSFEVLYEELESVVRRLEAGDLPLTESLQLFERGTRVAEQCNILLEQVELRVQLLTAGPNGEPSVSPLVSGTDEICP